MNSSGRRLPESIRSHVRRLLGQGVSARAVAVQVGISSTTVRNIRDEHQAPTAPLSARSMSIDFAPRPLPVVDTSGRSYSLFPRRSA